MGFFSSKFFSLISAFRWRWESVLGPVKINHVRNQENIEGIIFLLISNVKIERIVNFKNIIISFFLVKSCKLIFFQYFSRICN